jgi:signal transduction histidine kinase
LQTAILESTTYLIAERTREETTAILTAVHRQITALLRELPAPFSAEIAKLGVLEALRKEIYGELGAAFDEITWNADPQTIQASKSLSSLSCEVLFAAGREVARNAAHHGRADDPHRPLRLQVDATWRDGLELTVTDDGVGVSAGNGSSDGQGLVLYGACWRS